MSVSDDMLERIHAARKVHADGPRYARIMRRIVAAGLDALEAQDAYACCRCGRLFRPAGPCPACGEKHSRRLRVL